MPTGSPEVSFSRTGLYRYSLSSDSLGVPGEAAMDYYQGVVTEYLRADRSIFVNTECCIQLNKAENPDTSGPHWYCDAVAVDFRNEMVFLCEVSFAKGLGALLKRLAAWNTHWTGVRAAIVRDCSVPDQWEVRPWLFIPESYVPKAVTGIARLGDHDDPERLMPDPKITTLELVTPWSYCSWNRHGECPKPATIPDSMR